MTGGLCCGCCGRCGGGRCRAAAWPALALALALGLLGPIRRFELGMALLNRGAGALQRGLEDPAGDPLEPPVAQPSAALPGGWPMPPLGLGTAFKFGEAARRQVLAYLLAGGRHLDCAQFYANLGDVGRGVREAMRRGVPRSEIFLSVKMPPYLFTYEHARAWLPRVLEEMGLDYLDLALLHAPWPARIMPQTFPAAQCRTPQRCRQEAWRALSELRERGLVRSLGVSNFGPRQIGELLALKAAPVAVNQLEFHPWAPEAHRRAVDFCLRRGIAVTAYHVFGGGRVRKPLEDAALQGLAERHNRTVPQVLLRWALQKRLGAVVGAGRRAHLLEGLRIFDFELSADELALVDARGQREEDRWSTCPQHVPDGRE